MKTLFLLRHAKSDWADPDQRDFDRPLNARGRAAARAMGGELRRLGLAADRIVASPAARVTETLTLLADGYGGRMPVEQDARLYLAGAETLLAIVRATDERSERLLLVGHNPGLQALALLLAGAGPVAAEVEVKYPTGALVEIALSGKCWREVRPGGGEIRHFLRASDLLGDPEAEAP